MGHIYVSPFGHIRQVYGQAKQRCNKVYGTFGYIGYAPLMGTPKTKSIKENVMGKKSTTVETGLGDQQYNTITNNQANIATVLIQVLLMRLLQEKLLSRAKIRLLAINLHLPIISKQ